MSKKTTKSIVDGISDSFSIQFYLSGHPKKENRAIFANRVNEKNVADIAPYIQNINVYWDHDKPELDAEGINIAESIGSALFSNPVRSAYKQGTNHPRNSRRDDNGVYVPETPREGERQKQRNVEVFRGTPPRSTAQIQEFFSAENLNALGVTPS